MRKTFKRLVSLTLAALLCLSALPAGVLAAAEPVESETAAETVEEPVPETAAEAVGEPVPAEEAPAAETAEPAEEAPAGEVPAEEVPAEEPAEAAAAETAEAPAEETAGDGEAAETGETRLETVLETVSLDDETAPDNDERFAGYVNRTLGISDGTGGVVGDGTAASDPAANAVINLGGNLTGTTKTAYDYLKPIMAEIAGGEWPSTEIKISSEDLDLTTTSWTAAELGLSSLGSGGALSEEAKDAVMAKVGLDISALQSALLADCPYEMYWYDKTAGISAITTYGASVSREGVITKVSFASVTISFAVAAAYSATGAARTYAMNTAIPQRVNTAKTNAAAIVKRYAGVDDYTKLDNYRREICDLVSYNHDVVSSGNTGGYGDPWQLIYVFDGDESTNVVCEGYSKAFQYLCDLTKFYNSSICCYSVTGLMGRNVLTTQSGEGHMWNIVTMEDGKNYLVDVTNCDAGAAGYPNTAGYPDQLFLAGGTGNVYGGYAFSTTSGDIGYAYIDENGDRGVIETFGEARLTIASEDYVYEPKPVVTEYTQGGVIYSISAMAHSNWATVTGYTDGLPADLTIPVTVRGATVYRIEAGAFQGAALSGVTFPKSLTEIGASAFSGCSNLKNITFLGSAPSIGDGAFTGVTATVRYTAGNTWTAAVTGDYGGKLTWQSTLTEDSVGVTAFYQDGTAWADGVTLTAEKTDQLAANTVNSLANLATEKNPIRSTAYDITLTDADGKSVQPGGTVRVQLPVPPGYAGGRCEVYWVEDETAGTLTPMSASFSEADETLVFSTDHFSTYIVVQTIPETRAKGDVNGDDEISVSDAMTIAQAAVGLVELVEESDDWTAADYNTDKSVTAVDALLVVYAVITATA